MTLRVAANGRGELRVITIAGAGSVGLVLGARLALAGHDVAFLTRREDARAALEARGVTLVDPVRDQRATATVRAVCDPALLPPQYRSGIVVLCHRATETEALVPTLTAALGGALFACAHNDVDNEAKLARHTSKVAGLVMRQTCTRRGETEALATGPGRIVVGDHPTDIGPDTERLAQACEDAGYDVGRSPEIARDKWLKLCVNLMSTPNALVRRDDHATHAFVEAKARLLEEARDALAGGSIVASSCDGRDRSLEEEIAWQRASLATGESARALPLYNAVWMALRHPGLGLEADRYHARIIALGERHGVATPTHRVALGALMHALETGAGPESVRAEALLA